MRGPIHHSGLFAALLFLLGSLATALLGARVQAAPIRSPSQDNVVISEFRSNGPRPGYEDLDDFVEIFNPTGRAIDIGSWRIESISSVGVRKRLAQFPSGTIIYPGQHYLAAGARYSGSNPKDLTFTLIGIEDTGGAALVDSSGGTVDLVGTSSLAAEGTPLAPLLGNLDQSYERQPGGAAGSCIDTDDNAADFRLQAPSDPQNSASPFITPVCGAATETATPTHTSTLPSTATDTPTPTDTPTATLPATVTDTPEASPTLTWTSTFTLSPTPTFTRTPTPTRTASLTRTLSPTRTPSPTRTASLTRTLSPTKTASLTRTLSPTRTLTLTRTASLTKTLSPTRTASPTRTPTFTRTASLTRTLSPTRTHTFTRTASLTRTLSPTRTRTFTRTASVTRTRTFTRTASVTRTLTATRTASLTRTPSVTRTASLTHTQTPWLTGTVTRTRTPTRTGTPIPGFVAINEVLPQPDADWNDDGELSNGDEYIELINLGETSISLKAWTLDSGEVTTGYALPDLSLRPQQILVFFRYETNLTLSDSGGTVRLVNAKGQTADTFTFPPVTTHNRTWCLLPAEAARLSFICIPTPGRPNVRYLEPYSVTEAEFSCRLPDTVPAAVAAAECGGPGRKIWRPPLMEPVWLPEGGKWDAFVE